MACPNGDALTPIQNRGSTCASGGSHEFSFHLFWVVQKEILIGVMYSVLVYICKNK